MHAPTARPVAFLLNVAHAIDHMFLLIFATAVAAIAADFGFADWESLMPYGVGAFMLFGLGSLPAGRLGDLWGRRQMMLLFFFGMGASALLVAVTRDAWQLAAALTLMGAFSSIYHPVGIPMLVRGSARPGLAIGINGLAGNLGVALAAVTTGFLVKYVGWRSAFVVPAFLSIACGVIFARMAPEELAPPAPRCADACTNVQDNMRIAQEEIFGPVISAISFKDSDEFIKRAMPTTFGLGSGVWTTNVSKAHQVAKALRAGSVWVNCYQAMDPAVPFGGYKMSGYGRESGKQHVEEYLNVKAVWIKTA